MSHFLDKLIGRHTTDGRTRLQDGKGNRVGWAQAVHIPQAVGSYLGWRFFDYRPATPWLGYDAIQRLDGLITREMKVLEFGSGMSTRWLAARCGLLHSVECDAEWHAKVSQTLTGEEFSHVNYVFRPAAESAQLDEYADGFFDFALVDGMVRDRCVATALRKVRPEGYIYLDNTDMQLPDGDMGAAEAMLLAAAERVEWFTDFAPTLLFPTQGLLVRLAGGAGGSA